MPTRVQDLALISNAQTGDKFVGERVDGTTVRIPYNEPESLTAHSGGTNQDIPITTKGTGQVIIHYSDTRSGTVVSPLSVKANTTNIASVGIGTGIDFSAENQSGVDVLIGKYSFACSSVSTSLESSYASIHTKNTASGPLKEAYRFSTSNSASISPVIFTHNNTANRTITIPDYTGTMGIISNGLTANTVLTINGSSQVQSTTSLPDNLALQNFSVSTNINDTNGNTYINFTPTSSAVNYFNITNAIAGSPPTISAVGSDTDASIKIASKGNSPVMLYGASGGTTALSIFNGTTYQHRTNISFSNTSAIRALTVPDYGGTVVVSSNGLNANTILTVDGSGVVNTTNSITNPSIVDSNGNKYLDFTSVASAVNYYNITNAATGNPPALTAAGTDTNITAKISSKGTSPVDLYGGLGGSSALRILNGTTYQHITSFSFSNTSATRTITVPDINGTLAVVTGMSSSSLVLTDPTGAFFTTSLTLPAGTTFGVLKTSGSSSIRDSNNVNILAFSQVSSAINYLNMSNAAAGNPPLISSVGGDTNIPLQLSSKGTSPIQLYGASGGTGVLNLYSGTSYQHITQFTASNTANTRTITIPDATGTMGVFSSVANNAVAVTDGSGNQSYSTTLPSSLTIPGYATSGANSNITSLTGITGAIKAPTFINDSNNNPVQGFSSVASSVNYVNITNAATGSGPVISAAGTDTNINLLLQAKGTGGAFLYGALGSTSPVGFVNGTAFQHITLFSFSNTSAIRTVTFPDADGTVAFQADGTFTPVLAFGGASVGITYTTQSGSYSKIGSVVTFTLQIVLSNKGSSTGAASISGLPFAARSGIPSSAFTVVPGYSYSGTPSTSLSAGASTINLQAYSTAGVGSNIDNTNFSNTSLVIISGSYLV